MSDLVEWLTKILDEDEAQAKAATPGPWLWIDPGPPHKLALVGGDRHQMIVPSRVPDVWPSVTDGTFIVRHDPAAVLADVASKRAIIARHAAVRLSGDTRCAVCIKPEWPCATLHDMATAYTDRPGYEESWRTTAEVN